MSEQDGGGAADQILAWGFLLAFVFLTSAARAFYSSQSIPTSPRFELVAGWGLLVLLWRWVKVQGRACGASFPMDLGLFLVLLSFFAVPFLLWRAERWRSVGKAMLLLAIWVAGYLLTLVLSHAIVWMR